MNSTTGWPESSPTDTATPPSIIDTIIGLLALVLALAAVVVGVAQYLQARAAKRRHSDTEAGVEMPVIPSHHSDTDPVGSMTR
jgi:hypothetical protein